MRTSSGQSQLTGNAADSVGNIAAIVLAAGASSRLGAPKQLLIDESGVTLVARATIVARDAGATPIIVVTGAQSELVRAALNETPLTPGVQIAHNDAWRNGVASSITTGVRAVMEYGPNASAVIIIACDMPGVSSAHLMLLMQHFRSGAARVASSYGGTRGNPALIARNEWNELLVLVGDRGARSLLARDGTATVELELGALDIDTPDDVTRWRKLSSQQ